MSWRWWVLLVAASAGCSTDPCGGAAGVCIAARVEGPSVGALDQLYIAVQGLGAHDSPSTAGTAFSLPAKVGIDLPASIGANAQITVVGMHNGAAVTLPSQHTVAITNNRGAQTFTLMPAGNTVVDLQAPPDLSGGPIQIAPTSYTFANTVPSGTVSTELARFIVTNTTTETISLGSPPSDGGMMFDQSFSPAAASTCTPDPSTMGFLVAPGNCTIDFTFDPTGAGKHSVTYPVMAIGQTSKKAYGAIDITLTGTATAGWAGEQGPQQLAGVWGSGPTDIYVVGRDGIAHSAGDGNWSMLNVPGFDVSNLQAVSGLNAGMVWVAGATSSGQELIGLAQSAAPPSTGLTNFVADPFGGATLSTTVRALDVTSGTPIALSDTQRLTRNATGQWQGDSTIPQGAAYAVRPLLIVNQAGAFYQVGTSWTPVAAPAPADFGVPPMGQLRSAWGDGMDIFIVGVAQMNGHGLVWHYPTGSLGSAPTFEDPNVNGDLLAVTGRLTTNGPEVWAVGSLGAHVAHRTPDGVWHNEALPGNTNGQLRAVWVDSGSGDVVAVGDGIAHFH